MLLLILNVTLTLTEPILNKANWTVHNINFDINN